MEVLYMAICEPLPLGTGVIMASERKFVVPSFLSSDLITLFWIDI